MPFVVRGLTADVSDARDVRPTLPPHPADDPTYSDNDWWNKYFLLFTNKLNELHEKSVRTKNILDIFVGDFEDMKVMQQIALLTDAVHGAVFYFPVDEV